MTFKRDKVLNASDHVAFHMDKIMEAFKPGAKITLIVRPYASTNGSMDFVMSDDDLDEAIAVLQRRKAKGNEYPSNNSAESNNG